MQTSQPLLRAAASAGQAARNGVWTLTLWTAGRAPVLIGIGSQGVGLTAIGRIVSDECRAIEGRFPTVLRDEFVVLPDRVRILVHVPPGPERLTVGRLVTWLKARVARAARRSGLSATPLWEKGYEGQVLLGPEELAICRRRIRAGLAGLGEAANRR